MESISTEKNGYELTTACLFAMGRSSFIDIVARMKRITPRMACSRAMQEQLPSVIRGFNSTSSRITQASYGLQNTFSLTCALLIAMQKKDLCTKLLYP